MPVKPAWGATNYVGEDRRHRTVGHAPWPTRRQRWAIGAVAFYVLVLSTSVASVLNAPRLVGILTIVQVVKAVVFVAAGLAGVLAWRLTGAAQCGLLGAALLLYGALNAPLAGLSVLLSNANTLGALTPLAHSIVSIVVLGLIGRALWIDEVHSGIDSVRAALWGAVAAIGLVVGLVEFAGTTLVQQPRGPVDLILEGIATTGWLAGAAVAATAKSSRSWPRWWSVAFALLAVSEACRTFALAWSPAVLDAAVIGTTAGALLLAGNLYALLIVLTEHGADVFTLQGLLQSSAARLAADHARDEERTHDARAAVAAVRMATSTLLRYRERMDLSMRTSLELAVEAEFKRLVDLVSTPKDIDAFAEFDLAATVTHAVVTASSRGPSIDLGFLGDSFQAFGSASGTATVLHTLLDNARLHGLGAPVSVTVSRDDDRLRVTVADDGPGVRPDEAALIFGRGGRGSLASNIPGQGLGLFTARQTMEGQFGSLELRDDSDIGGSFVMSLRRADAPAPSTSRSDGSSLEASVIGACGSAS